MNAWDIIIIAVVAFCVFLAVRRIVANKKSGKGCCGCSSSCSSCSGCSSCSACSACKLADQVSNIKVK